MEYGASCERILVGARRDWRTYECAGGAAFRAAPLDCRAGRHSLQNVWFPMIWQLDPADLHSWLPLRCEELPSELQRGLPICWDDDPSEPNVWLPSG